MREASAKKGGDDLSGVALAKPEPLPYITRFGAARIRATGGDKPLPYIPTHL